MNFLKYNTLCLLIIFIMPSSIIAQEFLLGEETKGVTISVAEDASLTMRFRLQPRLEFGDLTKSRDQRLYESESDLFIRRARLEFSGYLINNLKYAVHLYGDKWGKAGHDDEIKLLYSYLDYMFSDKFAMRGGKAKLPYSRVSLASSSKQLLIERPVSTEAAKKVFDDFYQPNLLLHGEFLEGILAYNLAYGDGWEEGETLRVGNTIHKAGPLFVGRIELSPPGWIEKKKSDAHLGKGRHLTLGLHYAIQDSIEYQENTFGEDRDLSGFDLSGHWQGITAQFEYNQWKEEFTQPAKNSTEPKGWYLQLGYFIRGINLEPAARYEEYDQDSNANEKKEKVWTVGVNWYAKGHSLKISASWAHTKLDRQAGGWLTGDDKKDIFQVQAQFYF